MAQPKNIAALALIVAAVGFLFWIFPIQTNAPDGGSIDKPIQSAGELAVTHHFEGGMHTYSGIIYKPTPCHEFELNVRFRFSEPPQVTLDLMLKDSGGICIQVIEEEAFTITFEASEDAVVDAMINGERVELLVTDR